ncbi:hypothetical protein LSH36_20g15017 [Paralvinella palmiformis]|uniref:Reverse transcriptase domain-containing protein n=1 Tax=Paralvinella palmiformis TaxID=53620 RepID=A0AAD9KCI3_9ANNE|nr:hypothetical protein LSH36_20g15017 [Paralvinella palmiformis]
MSATRRNFNGPKDKNPLTDEKWKRQEISRANDIRERTLKIHFDTKGKPYNRFDVGLALTQLVPAAELEHLGPLSRNAEWYVTLRSDESKQKMLNAGEVVVNNFKGSLRPFLKKRLKYEYTGFRLEYRMNVLRDNYKPLLVKPLCKAFDRVSHDFLFAALQSYGFGDSIIKWVQLLYKDITSIIEVDGFFSKPLQITRGVRQGCPLSPLLYVLYKKILSQPELNISNTMFFLGRLYAPRIRSLPDYKLSVKSIVPGESSAYYIHSTQTVHSLEPNVKY